MLNVNKVIVAGVLVEDPPLRKTGGGTSVTTVLLEVTREWDKDNAHKTEVSQVEVDVFGRAAENVNKYLKTGDPVLFEGHLKLETGESAGQQCARLIVVAEGMQFISDGREGGGGGGNRRSQSTGARP